MYTVSPADGNSIAIENLTTFTTADKTVAVDLPDLDDNDGHGVAGTQEIVVYSQGDAEGAVTVAYTFIINYLADTTGTDLYLQSDTTKTALNELTVYGGKVTNIENLKKEWYDHNGDKWNWTFYDKNGDVVTDEGTDTTALSHAEVTVTSADKASAKYVISFETVATTNVEELAEAMVKMYPTKTPQQIADAIYLASPADNRVGDNEIVPALIKAGVEPEAIFASFRHVSTVGAADYAGYMKNGGAEREDIVAGYVDYWMTAKKGLPEKISVTEKDGVYAVVVDSTISAGDVAGMDTDLFEVARAAGFDDVMTDVKLTWDGGVGYTGNVTSAEKAKETVGVMIQQLQAGNVEKYEFSISLDDVVYHGTMELK